ncbi:signal peptidase I [Neobacillus sp. NRS-1170]|uniref:signal peptidase I n=1 Tax=Neobacillus sp. NRS-1170 TaxID=3233898 RepID=UPI003D2932AF
MNKMIFKRLSTVLVILVIGCIGFLLFISYQAKKEINDIPSIFGYKPLTVLTNSMQPKISAGDMIFVKNKKAVDVKVGDIITFKVTEPNTKTKLITHRVKRVSDSGFITKGDNNNVQDNWEVKPTDLLGEVSIIIPNAGHIAKFVSSPIGFLIFIILPLLLFILIEVYERILKILNKKEDQVIS